MYFTVCIPVYNRQKLISRALDSLVDQIFRDFEVIVVDDGSIDQTKQVVEQYKDVLNLKYIFKENGGKHSAINVGLDNAEGEFFLILDSDDWLLKDALDNMHKLCEVIIADCNYSGVMMRCALPKENKMLGNPFPSEMFESSYVDFHFGSGRKNHYEDCFECNKLKVMKLYRFPIDQNTAFIPEAWLFDQIGTKYKMLCSNIIGEYRELQADGLSNDKTLKIKNNIGFLYHYISRIENVFPNTKVSLANKVVAWWRYWQAVNLDYEELGPRCKSISLLGYVVKILMPLLNFGYKKLYIDIYMQGR